MTAEAMLSEIAHGNRGAFTQLFRSYRPKFVRYATGVLAGDTHAAEDVVDEAFIAIWQNAHRYTQVGSAEGWMRRIVRNKAVDWIRRHREQLASPSEVKMHQLECVDDGPSPFDTLAQASISAKLRQALSLLSVDQRDVVWLCYFEDKSLSDIADIMQCPENTVKTRLFHARRKLREMVLV